MKMKRIVSFLVTFAMLFTMIPNIAFARENDTYIVSANTVYELTTSSTNKHSRAEYLWQDGNDVFIAVSTMQGKSVDKSTIWVGDKETNSTDIVNGSNEDKYTILKVNGSDISAGESEENGNSEKHYWRIIKFSNLEFQSVRTFDLEVTVNGAGHNIDKSTFTVIDPEVPEQFKIQVSVENGTATYGDEITPVSDSKITVNKGDDVTVTFTANPGYALDTVKVDGQTAILEQGNTYSFSHVTENHTINVVFSEDEIGVNDPDQGDGIPDKYQAVVTYNVEHGYWNDGNEDKGEKTEVVTLRDAEGNLDENGTGTLAKVPDVGDKPLNDTYEAGGWSPNTPANGTTVSAGDTTYTYTYKAKDPVPAKYTVTYYANGATSGQVPEDSTQYTVNDTVTVLENTGNLTKTDSVFLGWSTSQKELITTEEEADSVDILAAGETFEITASTDLYAVWAEDKIKNDDGNFTEGSDGVPDCYQAVVTYNVMGGTWADDRTESIHKVFDLYEKDANGDWKKKVSAPTLGGTVPTGMKPDTENHFIGDGKWDTAIGADTPVTGTIAYTYSFARDSGWTGQYDSIRVYMDQGTKDDFDDLGWKIYKQVQVYSDNYPVLGNRYFAPGIGYWYTTNPVAGVTGSDISEIVLRSRKPFGGYESITIPANGDDKYNVVFSEGTDEWIPSLKYLKIEITKKTTEPDEKYTVTYTDGVDNETIFADQVTQNLKKGDPTPAFDGDLTREGYDFDGWKPAVSATVQGNMTYIAQWKEKPVSPVNEGGQNDYVTIPEPPLTAMAQQLPKAPFLSMSTGTVRR